jgi:nucleoside 2-deoxyribosyltransferase
MLRSYIATPYNSGPLIVAENAKNGRTLAKYARLKGFNPLSPTENYNHLSDVVDERKIMELCINLLLLCDCVHFAPNWELSTGARIEHAIATATRIPIILVTHADLVSEKLSWIEKTSW